MKYSKRIWAEGLILWLFLSFSLFSYAQTSTNSPYSRYGIGDLQSQNFLKNKGMGGCSRAFSSPYNINFVNPASLSSLLLTTFEIAVAGNVTNFESGQRTQKSGTSALNYFALGFPVKNGKWGTAFGLMPFSNAGYNIYGINPGPNGIEQVHSYEGSGGINQFYLSNAWSPVKGLSLGLNTSYLFGTVTEDRRIDFADVSYLDVHVQDAVSYGDFYFNGGALITRDSLRLTPSDSIQRFDDRLEVIGDSIRIFEGMINRPNAIADSAYKAVTDSSIQATLRMLEEEYAQVEDAKRKVQMRKQRGDWSFSLGLTSSLGTHVKAKQDRITETYRGFGNNITPKDTIENIVRKEGIVNFPLSYGIGISMKKGNRWLLMADFSAQNWEEFSKFGEVDSLKNSWTASTGMQFTPNDRALKSYLQVIQYRLGFRYSHSYLQLRENRLTEYAITAGFGLPVKRAATYIQLYGEYGSRGTLEAGLIRENFFRFGIGITLNDRWFVKSKFE